MDISRGVLDNLMGRDRNLPKNSVHARDHYSNSDVFLVSCRYVNLSLSVFVSTHYFLTPFMIKDHAIRGMIHT